MVFYNDLLPGLAFQLIAFVMPFVEVGMAIAGWGLLRQPPRRPALGLTLIAGAVSGLALACYLMLSYSYFYVHVFNGDHPHAELAINGRTYVPRGEWHRLFVIARGNTIDVELFWEGKRLSRTLETDDMVVNLNPRQTIDVVPARFVDTIYPFSKHHPIPEATTISLDVIGAKQGGCDSFLSFDRANQQSVAAASSFESERTLCRLFVNPPTPRQPGVLAPRQRSE